MKHTTILLKKPCKSINLLIKHATLCLITDFSHLKKPKLAYVYYHYDSLF